MYKIKKIPIGVVVPFGIILFVMALDFVFGLILTARPQLGDSFGDMRHFSWQFMELAGWDLFTEVINNIADNKPGLLGDTRFYLILLLTYFIATAWFIYYFFLTAVKTSVKENRVSFFENKGRFLLAITCWMFLKQAVFAVLIPPWQGPDEPYHYIYVGSYTEEVSTLKEEIYKSAETFHFKKHYAQDDYPWYPLVYRWGKSEIRNHQSPLFYRLVAGLLEISGVSTLPGAIYIARTVSAICMTVSVLLVYAISLYIFSGSCRKTLARTAAFFSATLPQSSFLGSTMGSDSMMIMFANAAILSLILGLSKVPSGRSFPIFFFSAIFFSFFAFATKKSGFIVIPFILGGIIISCYIQYFKQIRYGMIYFMLLLCVGSGMLLILFKSYDFFNLYTIFTNKIFPLDARFYRLINESWWFFDLRYHMITFVSFWLTFGWMVFKMSIGSYIFLLLLSVVTLGGIIKKYAGCGVEVRQGLFNLLLVFGVTAFVVLTYKDSQGRFLYIAISAWAVLFISGLLSLVPVKRYSNICSIITGNLFLFNLASVFGILIPVFYSNSH